MDPIEIAYQTQDAIPEAVRPLYTERNGRFELTGVNGIKTQADIDRLNTALTKERTDHRAAAERLKAFGDLDPADVMSKLDRYPELEAAAEGKVDEAKLNELAEARLRTKLGPVERAKAQAEAKLAELEAKVQEYETRERTRSIHDAVREAALKSKVVDTALDDVLMLSERVFEVDSEGRVITRDGVGVTPGVEASVWISDMQQKRPHWWPASQGSGAKGSGGTGGYANNPFSAEHWNLTKQGEIMRGQGREVADRMAKAAGTVIGGPRPAVKK